MCTESCLAFAKRSLGEADVRGKSVLEVGACDVNGSVRPDIEALGPARYLGVDLAPGPMVDEIGSADRLIARFGSGKFDLVICTELLEHARSWREVIHNLKGVLKGGGVLLMTARSKGFHFHKAPFDYWRFEIEDMSRIFSDFQIEALQADPLSPGVFIRARKPADFVEYDTRDIALYSILTGTKRTSISDIRIALFKLKLLPLMAVARLRLALISLLPGSFRLTVKRGLQALFRGKRYDFWDPR